MRKVAFVAYLFGVLLYAQPAAERPAFTDFPVKDIYSGKVAAPRLATDTDHAFRTMIVRGAKARVEFAGHYTIPQWGCGTNCARFVIVDSITGRVYDVPFFVVGIRLTWLDTHPSANADDRLQFRADSRLLKINGCPNERDCGLYDYEMVEGEGLKLLRKELLPQDFQIQ